MKEQVKKICTTCGATISGTFDVSKDRGTFICPHCNEAQYANDSEHTSNKKKSLLGRILRPSK